MRSARAPSLLLAYPTYRHSRERFLTTDKTDGIPSATAAADSSNPKRPLCAIQCPLYMRSWHGAGQRGSGGVYLILRLFNLRFTFWGGRGLDQHGHGKTFPLFWGGMRLYRALRGCSCGSRGFLEDRMMDIITGRAPPPALSRVTAPKGRSRARTVWAVPGSTCKAETCG